MASRNVLKLALRLEEEFNIKVDVESFYNTRVGKHQRSAGAFTWIINTKEIDGKKVRATLGGFEPLSLHIVKKTKIDIQKNEFGFFEVYLEKIL